MPLDLADTAVPAVDFSHINKTYAPYSIRLQNGEDDTWVAGLHAQVFGPGRFARTAFRVREMYGIDPALCLIVEFEGQRVGSVWMTPISLSGVAGYLLGPLAAEENFRKQGVGRMLVKTVTDLALFGKSHEPQKTRPYKTTGDNLKNSKQNELQKNFVLLVGDAPYYAPLGFEICEKNAIVFPGPVDPERLLIARNFIPEGMQLSGKISGCTSHGQILGAKYTKRT